MIHVVVCTHQRPDRMLWLLRDLSRQRVCPAFIVHVVDDASLADYAPVRAFIAAFPGWTYQRTSAPHGREGYAILQSEVFAWLRERMAADDYLLRLDDDHRILPDCIAQAWWLWHSIDDPRKATLALWRATSQLGNIGWTDFEPVPLGEVVQTQWVDQTYLAPRSTMDALEWRMDPIRRCRATRGSGTGAQMSRRLVDAGRTLYHTDRSMVWHPPDRQSVMNGHLPPFALHKPIEVAPPGPAEMVSASLCSIPERRDALRRAVESLLPQVDIVRVFLNGYSDVPDFLDHPRVRVATSQDHGDLGDARKFWWSADVAGYHMVCDDDIVFPPDYAAGMVASIERYGRRAVVGVHGVTLHHPLGPGGYYGSRDVFHSALGVAEDLPVHLVATSCCAYHASTISLSPADFPEANMADIWLGVACQRQRVPVVCVAHSADWLTHCAEVQAGGIYRACKRRDGSARDTSARQTEVVASLGEWTVHATAPAAVRHAPTPVLPVVSCAHGTATVAGDHVDDADVGRMVFLESVTESPRPGALSPSSQRRRQRRPLAISPRANGHATVTALLGDWRAEMQVFAGDHVGRLMDGAWYESDVIGILLESGRPGAWIDVGAYVGTHAVPFAALAKQATSVVAIEPRAASAVLLRANLAHHARVPVVVLEAAVHDLWQSVRVDDGPAGNLGMSAVAGGGDVRCVRLDDLICGPVGVLKIDVEGAQDAVLRSAARILREQHPVLCVELATDAEFARASAWLVSAGYAGQPTCRGRTPTYIWTT